MAQKQECSDFPIACKSCIGPVPYLQLKKEDRCMKCKLCTQPFTVFRWKPNQDDKFKKTFVCKTCANLRNVCQVCLIGLNHELPVQAPATCPSINPNDDVPHRDVNMQFLADEHDHRPRDATVYKSTYGRAEQNYTLLRHQRRMPFYHRNTTPVCRFFQRSQCTKGVACPYRHEITPVTAADLSEHNLEDQCHGYVNSFPFRPKPIQAQGIQERPSPIYYPHIPQPIQQKNTPYSSMAYQRIGSLITSQQAKLNEDAYWAPRPL